MCSKVMKMMSIGACSTCANAKCIYYISDCLAKNSPFTSGHEKDCCLLHGPTHASGIPNPKKKVKCKYCTMVKFVVQHESMDDCHWDPDMKF